MSGVKQIVQIAEMVKHVAARKPAISWLPERRLWFTVWTDGTRFLSKNIEGAVARLKEDPHCPP